MRLFLTTQQQLATLKESETSRFLTAGEQIKSKGIFLEASTTCLHARRIKKMLTMQFFVMYKQATI